MTDITRRGTELTLGSWKVYPSLNLLENHNRSLKIEPRPMDVLVHLAGRPGEVVSIDELLATVWNGTVVGDSSVYVAIKQLRRALAADGDDTIYIETIPKRGYRLAVPVERVSAIRTGDPRRVSLTVAAAAAAAAVILGGAAYLALTGPDLSPPQADAASVPLRDYEITLLTVTGDAGAPAISTDGRFAVYTDTNGLWLRQVSPASHVPIVPSSSGIVAIAPTITPDGTLVDFVGMHSSGDSPVPALWRVALIGGTPQRLLDNVWSPVGWSPDGRQMAFVRWHPDQDTTALVVADADGHNEHVVATRDARRFFVHLGILGNPMIRPAWSPDGRTIALFDFEPEAFESRVVMIDVNTGAQTVRDARRGVIGQGLAWLSPSALIVNQSADSRRPSQLWRMSYPDGALTPLTNDLMRYVGIDIDGARNSLVTSRRETRVALWIGDASGTGSEVVPSFPYNGVPWVSWAGERVLYGGMTPDGQRTVAAILPDSGVPEEIVPNGMQGSGSADGKTVVLMSDGAIWKVDAGEGESLSLLLPSGSAPVVSSDGRHVVFLSTRNGTQAPWIMSTNGGEPVEIVREFAALGSVDISRDGRLLFGSSSGLVVCDLPACTNRHDLSLPGSHVRWMPDGQSIAYLDPADGNIWSIPLDGGPWSQITRFERNPPRTSIAGFAWSHDGEQLAIVRATDTSDIVLLRDLR